MKCVINGFNFKINFQHYFTGAGKKRRRVTTCEVLKNPGTPDEQIAYRSQITLSTRRRVPGVLIDLEQAGEVLNSVAATLCAQYGVNDDFRVSFRQLSEESEIVLECLAELKHTLVKRDVDNRKLACTIALGRAFPTVKDDPEKNQESKDLRRKFLRAWANRAQRTMPAQTKSAPTSSS